MSTFKAVIGQSPHHYVMGRRVELARYLLGSSHLSLSRIAAEVGFASQSHMNRHFKRILGITPKQAKPDKT
ncbi:MAG: helix-turn-helix domain-containing protein [Synechococcaceae cyanobacterium SM2_3_1]|nr:helix-turn-helix domain-containing protein [Synechococcaceae cyanobacterium SM2_3_1]